MEIQVQKLRDALGLLEGVAGRKSARASSTLPILGNVLLRDGKVTATDMETAVTVELPEAEGECLLPFDRAAKLLKYVDGNDRVTIETKEGQVNLVWSEGKAALQIELTIEDYPQLPAMEPLISASLPGDKLVPDLLSMLDYCATESSRPVLCGVSLFLGESLEIAAGDGFRMACKTLPLSMPPADGISTVVIPSKAVSILGQVWKKAPRPAVREGTIADLVATRGKLDVAVSPTLLEVRFGVVSLLIRTVAGTPPDFKRLIPEDSSNSVQFYAPDFEVSLRRLMAADARTAVCMAWSGGSMVLSSQVKEESSIEVSMPVQSLNGEGKVTVNLKYLQEYISGKTGLITMAVTAPSSPVLFRYSNSPLVLIMPMSVQ